MTSSIYKPPPQTSTIDPIPNNKSACRVSQTDRSLLTALRATFLGPFVFNMPPRDEPRHSLVSIAQTLLPSTRLAFPPMHSTFPALTSTIASLSLHPTLEALLHILNADLPSAHFLVRHMQAVPAVEGMLLHSILHRAEGDMPNARAWMGDVVDACEGWVPKRRGKEGLGEDVKRGIQGPKGEGSLVDVVYGSKGPGELIDAVEALRKKREKDRAEGEVQAIEERIRDELSRVLEWCKDKFGEGVWVDASSAWTKDSEEVREVNERMVSGGKGWREF